MPAAATDPFNARLIDSLYTEALLLADEARFYFDEGARSARTLLDPLTRVGFSCESLKVTTRLMHIVAWLLTQRGGESGDVAGRSDIRTLGVAAESDDDLVARFPEEARTLIAASIDLYGRVQRLAEGGEAIPSPARALIDRLESSI